MLVSKAKLRIEVKQLHSPPVWLIWTCIWLVIRSWVQGRPQRLSWMQVKLVIRKSWVRSPSGPATFFCGYWSRHIFYGHSLLQIQEGQLSVSSTRMCTNTCFLFFFISCPFIFYALIQFFEDKYHCFLDKLYLAELWNPVMYDWKQLYMYNEPCYYIVDFLCICKYTFAVGQFWWSHSSPWLSAFGYTC